MSIEINTVDPAPWSRFQWGGELRSLDGTATDDFTRDDVDEVLAWHENGDRWDGNTAGIARLRDGRLIAWEADYGPTGNGFVCDAYGGDADILFAATIDAAMAALSEWARDALRAQVAS